MAYNIFPLDAFVEYLAFDSSDEAVKFLQQFFLELDVTDANLINVREGRNVFMPGGEAPNVSSIQQTTCRWIELKAQNQPLSKILCNNPMAICPEILNILPKPVDSFSRDNLYMNDPVLNELFTDVILDTRKSLRVEEQDVKLNEPPTFSFTRALQSAVGIQIGTGQKRSSLSELMLSLQEGIVDRVVQTEIINIILKIMRENNLIKRAIGHWKTFTKNKRLRKSAIKLSETLFDNIIDTQLRVHATRAFRIYQTEYNIQLANIIATAQMDSILDKLIPELLCKIARRTRANQVRDIEQRLEHIRENLHLKWLRQFTNHWLSVTRRNRILRNITFIAPGNIRSSLTLSPSRRLFRPGIKNLTPERMQEMAEERMRRIEEERKRRQEEEEQNNLRENGTSSNTGGRHLRPAMAIREQVLDGVSFENVDRPFYFASANLNLFCPVRQQISPELLQKMAERKLRQNDYLRQHQRDSRTTTENGIHARTDEEGYFDDQRQQHTGPSSSKRARLNYF